MSKWSDAQKGELGFWRDQYQRGNPEQQARNDYYMHPLENGCTLLAEVLRRDWTGKVVVDVGSGPEGILHAIDADTKVAIDPLMEEYAKLGFNITRDDILAITDTAEGFVMKADLILCLNALDHTDFPHRSLRNMAANLKEGGTLAILTDMRLPEQCDTLHPHSLGVEIILDTLFLSGLVCVEFDIVPHQAGNPIVQFVGIFERESMEKKPPVPGVDVALKDSRPEAVIADCCGYAQRGSHLYASVNDKWALYIWFTANPAKANEISVLRIPDVVSCQFCGAKLSDAPTRKYHWGVDYLDNALLAK